MARWVERLLTWMCALGVAAMFGVLLLGPDLVPLILGRDYDDVTVNLLPLTMSLVTLAVGSVGRLLTLALGRPKAAIVAAALGLAAFWGVGAPLVAWGGSFAGASRRWSRQPCMQWRLGGIQRGRCPTH